MKKLSKIYITFLLLLFAITAANSTISAQNQNKIVSGEYGSILLGVDSNDNLTGYFHEETGNSSCIFFISGNKQSNGDYKIKTWYPGYPEVISGELKFVMENGEKSVNLKLDDEHGGCGNANPIISRDGGQTFGLTETGNWESIRVVSAKKGYFYKSAEAKAPQKSYVIQNDVVRVNQTKGNKFNVTFVSDEGRKTLGWIKASDFYSVSAPKSK